MVVDVSPRPPADPVYLGDAVYASFDGFHIHLHLGSHTSPSVVALEPAVIAELVSYFNLSCFPNRSDD